MYSRHAYTCTLYILYMYIHDYMYLQDDGLLRFAKGNSQDISPVSTLLK